ncbi:putative leader peptide [Streptomyces sp. NPDC045714]
MSGRTVVPSASAPAVPVPLALTARRHIDLARVSSAACR